MQWLDYLAWLLGGAFAANAIPHLVSGMMGRPFQSPFAKPPGEGLSSSTVNVLWGSANLAVGYLLIGKVGRFDLGDALDGAAAGLGAFLIALLSANLFGRFNGGNSSGR